MSMGNSAMDQRAHWLIQQRPKSVTLAMVQRWAKKRDPKEMDPLFRLTKESRWTEEKCQSRIGFSKGPSCRLPVYVWADEVKQPSSPAHLPASVQTGLSLLKTMTRLSPQGNSPSRRRRSVSHEVICLPATESHRHINFSSHTGPCKQRFKDNSARVFLLGSQFS